MNRQPLFRKYVAVFVILVSGALVTSGLLQLYFSYQENQAALLSIQREKAAGASTQIAQFLQEIERQIGGSIELGPPGSPVSADQRRSDYLRLLRQAPAITEIGYLNGSGREQLRISRLAMNVVGSGTDYSQDPKFLKALSGKTYFSPVYFRNESEPYMTIAIAEGGSGNGGVSVAEVNLKFIWDVVSQIKIGQAGYAYVADADGRLIAHPDISLVLQRTDLSSLLQVHAARSNGEAATIANDLKGRQVLTARAAVDPPGWWVFVEQPLEEAFAPLYASLLRTVLLVVAGVVLSVLASLILARRMVRPIQALQVGATRIGSGALDLRIDVRTGDELEALGESFNRMAGQLRESYATLEQKVEERTADLEGALGKLRALGEVSQAVNSSLDLEEVLTTIVAHAVELSGTDAGTIYEFDENVQEFQPRVSHGMSAEVVEALRQAHIRLGEALVGEAAARRAPVQTPDFRSEPLSGVISSSMRPVVEQAGFRALLAVPLLREDSVIGALVVRRREPGEFSQETMDLLQTFATQSVLAIQNARLFHEIDQKSRQLEVASRHKSEFLANMSHELRTPLNAIIGFSEVLTERLFGEVNAKQAEYLEDILASGRHLLSLINDILDLSKVEAGRMELEVGSFSLSDALENGLTMIRERASQHGVALSLDVDPAVGVVKADERKVKQVIFNLLSNAVKFTGDGGQVDVTARVVDARVQIAVRDTGIGIAAEDQQRIFEEFQQAGSAAGRAPEGTGLGLALARKFVELHSGELWLESQVGVGSTFTFSLPIQPPAVDPGPPTPVRLRPETNGTVGPTVLVVEDNPHAVDLLSLYLHGDGFGVTVANDGAAGIALARDIHPAAIVLDILLPQMDGWDFLALAKADPEIAHIPVVIVSMLDERGKGFALGAADYLVKPVHRDSLLATMRRVTGRSGGPDQGARVLAIDDDPMALELIEAVLRPEGYTVLKATSGTEGIDLARTEQPKLVILDLLMPEIDGFAVVERLRSDPVTAGIPIIILTSRSMALEDKQRLNGQISYLARKGEFNRADFAEIVRGLCPVKVG
jgi:signal transduction histidine kinase/DNA-binding response OmpR family regulator